MRYTEHAMSRPQLSENQKKLLRQQVQAEFPDDETMQEVHYVRLLHHYQTKDLTPAARISFYTASKRKTKPFSPQ